MRPKSGFEFGGSQSEARSPATMRDLTGRQLVQVSHLVADERDIPCAGIVGPPIICTEPVDGSLVKTRTRETSKGRLEGPSSITTLNISIHAKHFSAGNPL